MAARSLLFSTLLLQFLAIACCICRKPRPPPPPPPPPTQNNTRIPVIFTFGDSFVDTGTNNYLVTVIKANHAPYGQSFPGRTATGRFSDGRLLSDFLAYSLNIKNAIPPFADPALLNEYLRSTGVCFASAGSGYDDLTTLLTNVLPVSKQVSNFADYVEKLDSYVGRVAAKNILQASLAIVVAGTNDFVINIYQTPTRQIHYGLSGYQDFILQKLQSFIEDLYSQGLRKFLIAGLPPIGCLPIQRATKLFLQKCVDDENLDSQAYNRKLIDLLPKIQAKLTSSKIVYADLYTPIDNMVANPSKYGLAVIDRGCCGTGLIEAGFLCKQFSPVCPNPNQFLFWDSANPTEAAHKVLAKFLIEHAMPQFFPKQEF